MRVLGRGAAVAAVAALLIAMLASSSSGATGLGIHATTATVTSTTTSSSTTSTTTTTASTTTTTTTPPTALAPDLSLHASATQIVGNQPVTLTGTVTGAPAGSLVGLYQSPYPFPAAALVKTTTTGSDGSFSFSVFPDRDTRYGVVLIGTAATALVQVDVSARTVIEVRATTLGRASIRILVFHPSDLRWAGARAHWLFPHGRHGRFRTGQTTRTRRLSRYVTLLSTTVALPAGGYRWRVCYHAPGDQALLSPQRPPGCSGQGYQGSGRLPLGFPGPGAVARAASYLRGRAGRTAFAVVDSEGRMSGMHVHSTFVSASVVKAMLLVAYLRRLHQRGQHYVDSYSNSFLYPMINVSDNSAATTTWSIVGDGGLYAVAHAAHMTDFSISGIWANAQISAADQAKFFFAMDSLLPGEFVSYARRLLSTIAGYESWGIPAVARPRGYRVFFKGGWRGTGLGQLVHQVARLEGHRRTFSIAVMTDGDPSMGYGIDTIQGVTARLL